MWEIETCGKSVRTSVQVARINVAPLLRAKAGLGTWHRNIPPVRPNARCSAAKCTKMHENNTYPHQASSSYIYSIIYIHHYTSLYTPRCLYVVSTSYTGSDNGDFNFALPFTAHSGFCSKSQAFGTGMKNDESMALGSLGSLGDCVMNSVMTLRHITPLRHMVPALQLPPASPG